MQQTICLNMIVKNESHIIEETLNSIYKYINYYVINDTGSTDDTCEKITNFFNSKNIKGEIINHEFRTCDCHDGVYKKYDWFHFGWNRSYALDKCIGKSDYILIMDADDILIGDLPIPKYMEHDCYNLKIGNYFTYYRPLLIRNEKYLNWKFIGGLHEYLDIGNIKKKMCLNGDYYIASRRLGNRSQDSDKYKKDAKIFEELLIDEPLNDRYLFYCAQSYYDFCDYENAMKYYEKNVLCGNFIEEVYYSLFRIAECKKNLNYQTEEIIQAYYKCYKYYPKRAEPLYEIIHYYRLRDMFKEGYSYAKLALSIPYPTNHILFVAKDVYDYKLFDEISVCAFYLGKYRESYMLCNRILEEKMYPEYIKERVLANRTFSKNNIKEKPILCFYVGYIPDYTKTENGVYGSELALKKISEYLTNYYDVYIFGTSFDSKTVNGVRFMNSYLLNDFGVKNEIDVMIISRYVHYFIEFNITARKTYLWLHDVLMQSSWNFNLLPNQGKHIVENVINKIDGIVVLCNWHKTYVSQFLNIDHNKIFIIGNGIEPIDFNHNITKIKNRFIYMSNINRGLSKLVEHFHVIKKYIPDAELYIYRGIENESDQQIVNSFEKYDYIKFMGKIPNKELISKIMEADYWYYPTNYCETYCISALEAQMAGCMCIASNVGALGDTIGDRGILLNESIYSDNYWNEALNAILNVNNNTDLKNSYISKSKDWAIKQSWNNIANLWFNLINKY